jgi:trimeric autotransporter adhesin
LNHIQKRFKQNRMKSYLLILVFTAISLLTHAQSIGINTLSPHSSAALDITSTNKGLLAPRLNTLQMNTIASPATGLAVFNTDSSSFCVFTGTQWVRLITSANVTADNLGNHIATKNINSGSFYISTDGSNKGLKINSTGASITGNSDSSLLTVGANTSNKAIINLSNDKLTWSAYANDSSFRIFNNFNNSNAIHIENPTTNNLVYIVRDKVMIGGAEEEPEAQLNVGGGIVVDKYNLGDGIFNNALKFGNFSGEGISSNRHAWGENISGLDFYTSNLRRLSITNTGNVGINNSSPSEKFHVNEGNFAVTGRIDSSASLLVGDNLNDTTSAMFFYPKKAAFRAGAVSSNLEWADEIIGKYSMALGKAGTASGEHSVAIGHEAYADSDHSIAIGNSAVATGVNSYTFGEVSIASGKNAVAIGSNGAAVNTNAIVIGNANSSLADSAISIGNSSTALGKNSFALGNNLTTNSYRESVFGTWNETYSPTSSTEWNAGDRLFVVGNGSSSSLKSNALTILKNGNTGIGTVSPTEKLEVNGKIKTTNFQLVNGASNGYVLKSNGSGEASWVNPTSLANGNWTTSGTNQYSALAGNVGIGTSSPTNKLHIVGNVGINDGRLVFTNTSSSILIGSNTGLNNVSSNANIFIGNESGYNNSTGNFNLGIGLNALTANKTGNSNLAFGYNSLASDTSGGFNVSIGSNALQFNKSGSSNVAIGYEAGNSSLGSGNIFIGYRAGMFETGSNKLYIANNNGNPPLLKGDFATKTITIDESLETKYLKITDGATNGYLLMSDANGYGVWTNPNSLPNANWIVSDTNQYSALSGNIGIGSSNPSEKLHVVGNIKIENGKLDFNNSKNSVIIGGNAGLSNAGDFNVFAGNESGRSNTTGFYNVFLGSFSGNKNTSGNYNTATGFGSFENNTTGSSNTGLGFFALNKNTTGMENVATGFGALEKNTTGSSNTGLGFYALNQNTSGTANAATGYGALEKNTTGSSNIALGFYALNKNTTGAENAATGYGALENNTTAFRNTATGFYALNKNTTGVKNVAIGYKSLQNNITANYNTAIGTEAMVLNTEGEENTVLGAFSMQNNTTGDYNAAIGLSALLQNTTGSKNVAIGYEAGYGNMSSDANTYIGHQAGYFNANGQANVFLGYQAGYNETQSNKLYISNSSTSNPLILGDFATKKITINDSIQSKFLQLTNGLSVVNANGSVNTNVRSENNAAVVAIEAPNQNEASLNIGTYANSTSSKRWQIGKSNSNENGGNAGGDFVLNRFNDAGAYIGQPFMITRNNGTVNIGNEGASATANTVRINGSMAVKVKTVVTSNNTTTLDGTDYMVIYGGTITGNTITLPAANTCSGRVYLIINHSSSIVTINGGINYFVTNSVTSNTIIAGASVQIVSDSTNWHKIN